MPVLDTEKKLEAFNSSIMDTVFDEALKHLDEMHAREAEIMEKAEKEIKEEVKHYRQRRFAEIRTAESHRVTTRMTENKRTILQLREEQARETFQEARERIRRFTESEEYPEHLCRLLQQAIDVLGYGFAAEVILRPEDMKYSDKLLSAAHGVSLAFREGDFRLGGLCLYCPAMGKRVDMNFDDSLAELVTHFADMSGLTVSE